MGIIRSVETNVEPLLFSVASTLRPSEPREGIVRPECGHLIPTVGHFLWPLAFPFQELFISVGSSSFIHTFSENQSFAPSALLNISSEEVLVVPLECHSAGVLG